MPTDFASHITGSQQRLYAYIRSLLANSAAAWDVLQETNLVLWRKQQEFVPGSNFDAWSFTVARFQVMAWLRDRKREPLGLMTPELCEVIADDAAAQAALFDQRLDALQRCREQLPERGSKIVELYYECGLSVKQVADELQMGGEAVKQALFRLRRALQNCIDQQELNRETA